MIPSASREPPSESATRPAPRIVSSDTAYRKRYRGIEPAATAAYVALLLSGLVGLGYQLAWVRGFAIALGQEHWSVLGVVAAFLAGLASGALLLDRRVSTSGRPGQWLAALELAIGLWSLALIVLLPLATRAVPWLLGPAPSVWAHAAIAFALPLLLMAPATVAMGATLPASDRLIAQLREARFALGLTYGINTAGAVLGVVLSSFVLLPMIGTRGSLLVFALGNACAAVLFLLVDRRVGGAPVGSTANKEAHERPVRVPAMPLLFLTGLLGIGYEVAMVRALAQVLQNTVYSYAAVLTVFLLGTSLGALLLEAAERRPFDSRWTEPRSLLVVTAAAALMGTTLLPLSRLVAGATALPGPFGEIGAAAIVLLLPTAAMGALFAALAAANRRAEHGVGAALAANTAGGALAPLLVGVGLLPAIGVVPTLLVLSSGYAFAALSFGVRRSALGILGVTAAASLVIATPLRPVLLQLPEGARILDTREGVAATVHVYEDAAGYRHLRLNNGFVMGGTASLVPDRRQGHLPFLLRPEADRALFVGIGTGATLAAASEHGVPTDGVELVPEVLGVMQAFDDVAGPALGDPNVSLVAGDARRYVAGTRRRYDVVVADTFHPARDGAGLLYTTEHFEAVRRTLTEDGVFVQWLPLHQLDLPTLQLIVRSFLTAFPETHAVLNDLSLETPVVGLLATGGAPLLPGRALRTAEADAVGFGGALSPLEGYVADPSALRRFAGEGPLNTDDRPLVVYRAPRTLYEGLGPADARLISLLETLGAPDAASLGVRSPTARARMARYWAARDAFLALGLSRREADSTSDLAAYAEPLLLIAAMSEDFEPAYDPVLAIATYERGRNPARARDLLRALVAVNPTRPEAAERLARWYGEG